MTISEAIEPFIEYCRSVRHASPATIGKYRDTFKCWIIPYFGYKDLLQLNAMDILKLRSVMYNKPVSVSRQYSVVMSLKLLLGFSRNMLNIECMDPAKVPLPRRPEPHVDYLTDEEINRVRTAININTFTGKRMRALVELLLGTGMRISEALSLKRDVFENDVQQVEISGKGKKRRTVFFMDTCGYWVRQYLAQRHDDCPELFVTTGYPARAFKREDVSRYFIALKEKAGITKKFTPHILRHTYCTTLRNNGADISHIKDLAGHQNINITARYYLGRDNSTLREVVKRCLPYASPGAHQVWQPETPPPAQLGPMS